jgi:hypothetical protein
MTHLFPAPFLAALAEPEPALAEPASGLFIFVFLVFEPVHPVF